METRIKELISEAETGSAAASEQLFAALYAELHRLADIQLRRIGPDVSLGTTTLLHEAYLDLAGREGVEFPDRARFMSYAARAMRGLVIDAHQYGGELFLPAQAATVRHAPRRQQAPSAPLRLGGCVQAQHPLAR